MIEPSWKHGYDDEYDGAPGWENVCGDCGRLVAHCKCRMEDEE